MPSNNRYHRQSIRLRGYDYTQPGIYFVTICTNSRHPFFDDPYLRRIAERYWESLPEYFTFITLDVWIVMPDHIHGLICINDRSAQLPSSTPSLQSGSLGAIILTYKSQVTRNIHKQKIASGVSIWQRGYWERIIRDETELSAVRRYIIDNPKREQEDNLDALVGRMSHRS